MIVAIIGLIAILVAIPFYNCPLSTLGAMMIALDAWGPL
jgi:hypothetical protein